MGMGKTRSLSTGAAQGHTCCLLETCALVSFLQEHNIFLLLQKGDQGWGSGWGERTNSPVNQSCPVELQGVRKKIT